MYKKGIIILLLISIFLPNMKVFADESLLKNAKSGLLMEVSTGKIIYEKNIHEKVSVASMTKMMGMVLIMESLEDGKIKLEDMVVVSKNASGMGGSQIWLDVRESLSVSDMIKAICVVSANDCVVAMADYLEGSQEAFVQKMNEKAQELGMNDTTFKNCHGIDEDGHLTSSYDIAIMSRELLLNHPDITKYTTIYMDSLRDGKSSLVNTNKLVKNFPGCTGLKTGSTSLALYNLSASATQNGMSLIGVIMKAPSSAIRFAEASKLLNYGFSNFSYTSLGNKGDIIKEVSVNKGIEKTVNLVVEQDVGKLLKKGTSKDISQEINISENISAPISKGDVLGEINFTFSDGSTMQVNLVAEKSIEKITFKNILNRVVTLWFNLFR